MDFPHPVEQELRWHKWLIRAKQAGGSVTDEKKRQDQLKRLEQSESALNDVAPVDDTLTAVFLQVIDRLESHFDPQVSHEVLSLLASAGRGLSERVLLDLVEGPEVSKEKGTSLILTDWGSIGEAVWMPRTARSIEAGMIYHVLNRRNGRLRLFHKEGDYDAFEEVLTEGLKRYPVALLTYCLMPNHWHLVVRSRSDVALGRMMGWIGVTHVRRHHEHYHRRGTGHLYQGRFKKFPVAEDVYFLTLCRYVEANAVRAKLVESAQQWRWCGPWRRAHPSNDFVLSPWPVNRPRNWTTLVDGGLLEKELQGVPGSGRVS